ncbi:hypothetical protein MMC10_001528 [Thelotrema lepadinum]|nr:hypothetical protein [Thelotrema lepadinum]
MDVFGTVAAAASLALAIKSFCDSLTCNAGDDRLVLQIQHDAAILDDFAEIFEKVISREDLEDHEKLLLKNVCVALKPLLERLEGWIETKRRMRGDGVNKATKWVDKVTSVLWKNADTRQLATELTAWTERYHIRLSLLPVELREKLLRDVSVAKSGDKRLETHVVTKDLRASFQAMSLAGSKTDVSILGNALLMAETSSSRVFGSYDKQRVIVEYKTYSGTLRGARLDQLSTAVERLAGILSHADTHLCRILKCLGYIHQENQERYALVYEVPFVADFGQKPPTLLDLIKSRKPGSQDLLPPQHPLNQRFELARKITCAILYVHAMGWVHKSIRTNNIIVLERRDDLDSGTTTTTARFPKSLGNPYLCGFDTARQDKAASDQTGDAFWDLNVYRHPARQGLHPEERYSMNHDVYSLGVVLLELGIWKPLLALSGFKTLKGGGPRTPHLVKEFFQKLAREALPIIMGQKYSDLVLFCLEIDGENPVTASTAVDEVLSKLEEMSSGLH